MNYTNFISKEKSLLIAPAGFGKTYSLANCLQQTPDDKRQLILTHTHAGIASIKEKISKFNIPSSKYHIETITGFAQKYTLAFYCQKDIPLQENSSLYYPFIVQKATELFNLKTIQKTINYSYDGLFVDEYQDCTDIQHQMITVLSQILPVHILGDPMQGIFDFNGNLVDFDNDLKDYEKVEQLETPWRWINVGRNDLGIDLKDIRTKLQKKETIKLSNYKSIETIICGENDWYQPRTLYRNNLIKLLDEESLLVIHPITSSIKPRIKILEQYNNRLMLLESIDSKDAYIIAKLIDNYDNESAILLVIKLAYSLFNKTGLDNWFNANGLKRKADNPSKRKTEELQKIIDEIQTKMDYSKLAIIIKKIMYLSEIKCYRKDLVFSICRALAIADSDNKTVYEAMVSHKNTIRRVGRKVYGKCIGTTLLTKGLEFDTVAILNAHQFDNYKHFYVAITRACKRLIIFTQSDEITFK